MKSIAHASSTVLVFLGMDYNEAIESIWCMNPNPNDLSVKQLKLICNKEFKQKI